MITKPEVDMALLLFDLLMTGAERVAGKIEEGKQAGFVTVEQQQNRMDKVADIRKAVGLPAPAAVPDPEAPTPPSPS